MVVEGRVVDPQMAVKVLLAADLGPRRIDAEGQETQQQIGDPDPEIDLAAAVEAELHESFTPLDDGRSGVFELPFTIVALPLLRIGQQLVGPARGVESFGNALLSDRLPETRHRPGVSPFDVLLVGCIGHFQHGVRTSRTHSFAPWALATRRGALTAV